jgi:hypothetical protein
VLGAGLIVTACKSRGWGGGEQCTVQPRARAGSHGGRSPDKVLTCPLHAATGGQGRRVFRASRKSRLRLASGRTPRCRQRPTRLPGARSLAAPPACGARSDASAHPVRVPAANARPRARVRPSERPREFSQSELGAGRAGVKRRRRPRLRATDPSAASRPSLLLGYFFLSFFFFFF